MGVTLKLKEAKLTNVNVVNDDITQVKADALITAINSSGMWFGGLDSAIQRSSGAQFHAQAQAAMPLKDGQVVYAPVQAATNGAFGAVVFIIDDLQKPLYELVTAGLEETVRHELTSVSIPTIRTGVMAGVFESRQKALSDLGIAVNDFVEKNPNKLDVINIVVYGNEADRLLLRHLCDTSY